MRSVISPLFVIAIMAIIAGCRHEISEVNQLEITALSSVWTPDLGDGTYKNPVIYADYSDPDVCRAGDNFYLTASSFNCVPALPVLHSKDLVNWTIIGHAIDRLEPAGWFDRPQHGNGVFAPSIRFHDNEFYIYYGDPDFGIFMLKTKDPAGPWSTPVLVKEGKGLIDPCPLWDDDGRVYMVHAYAASRSGIKSVLVVNELNSDGTEVISEDRLVFDGHDLHFTIEGPKFYKRNGFYYIFAPAGSVKTGWQTILRSKNVLGPYEDKIVLQQGSTDINGPHQGAWVDDVAGDSWFLHFQDMEAYGRVGHLQPVRWIDDWPEMGTGIHGKGVGEPVKTFNKPASSVEIVVHGASDSDEFNEPVIGPQWQWHANPRHFWAFPSPARGALRLNCIAYPEVYVNLWNLPNLLLQKFAAPEFTATTKLTFKTYREDSDKAGLLVMGRDYAYIAVEKRDHQLIISRAECMDAMGGTMETVIAETTTESSDLFFRVKVSEGAVCEFSYSLDGENFEILGELFTAMPGRWIGAKVGLFAVREGKTSDNGYADFDWFRITP